MPTPSLVFLIAPVVCFLAILHLPGNGQAADDCTVCPELHVLDDVAESCSPGIYGCAGPAKLVEACDKRCLHAHYFSKKTGVTNYTISLFCDDKTKARRPSGVLAKHPKVNVTLEVVSQV
ncbi:hypothetical protein Fcan01_19039 [Folsomia candida]|uniref:Secreted protein n=1 Tax=Folsomia candida TaxID=158441 RepID=A0A226DNL9_FOLCA|nr:hypothetical protein Fcan01_19039 [Folsomia candida]